MTKAAYFLKVLSLSAFLVTGAFNLLIASEGPSANGQKIVSIAINGNRTTSEKILKMFLQIDTGMVFDSAKVASAKQRLLATNLFSKVDIVSLVTDDGVRLYVIVQELFYCIPDGFGGAQYDTKYGNPNVWYRLRLGLIQNNFRGQLETFSIHTSLWEDRSLSVSWSKPLLPSAYSLGLGAGAYYYPDLNYPMNRFVASGQISLSRKLAYNSRTFISLIPTYTRIDSLDGNLEQKFKEIISAIGFSSDHRNDSYAPKIGWYIYEVFSNNAILSGIAPKYGQSYTDFRLYLPSFIIDQLFAFRIQSWLRTNNAGEYERINLGGEGSVRGYPSGYLGLLDTMNNSICISSEYRFPIWQTPPINFFYLTDRFCELQGCYYQLEGALIADFGHLWHDFLHPMQRRQNGGGIGMGLKIKAPTLRLSGSIDAVWPITKDLNNADAYYGKVVLFSQPEFHLYISIF